MNRSIRVLLVDDETQFRENTARLLKSRGFDVVTAQDGVHSLEIIQTERAFDVVVLDVNMPRMDGISALKKMKAVFPELNVIILTGAADMSLGIEAIRSGAYDFLTKPCPIEELMNKIDEAAKSGMIKSAPVLWMGNRVGVVLKKQFAVLDATVTLMEAAMRIRSTDDATATGTHFIIDNFNNVAGYVQLEDFIHEFSRNTGAENATWKDVCDHLAGLPDKKLVEVMHKDFLTASPDDSLVETAQTMLEHNIRLLPVVEDEELIGLASLRDILSYIEQIIE